MHAPLSGNDPVPLQAPQASRSHFGATSGSERWIPLLEESYEREMASSIDHLQAAWARHLERAIPDLRDASLFDILLCTREAVLNGLTHGCVQGGRTVVSIRYNASRVLVQVSDPGKGHSFTAHVRQDYDVLDKHRGLFLISQFASSMQMTRNGATLEMGFDLAGPVLPFKATD